MKNDQPVLTGIGLRALVETICKDKKASGGNLVEKIGFHWSRSAYSLPRRHNTHRDRTLGNDAAHDVKATHGGTTGLRLDVCEHLCRRLSVAPHARKKLR